MVKIDYLWQARKRNAIGLPWTFTVYTLKDDKLCVSSGILNKRYDEIRLYRIRDFTVKRSLLQRIFGLGTIHICSADSTHPEFDIMNIRDALQIKDMMSNQVEIARGNAGVSAKELMGARFDGDAELE